MTARVGSMRNVPPELGDEEKMLYHLLLAGVGAGRCALESRVTKDGLSRGVVSIINKDELIPVAVLIWDAPENLFADPLEDCDD